MGRGKINTIGGNTGFSQLKTISATPVAGRLPSVTVKDIQVFKAKAPVSFEKTVEDSPEHEQRHFQKYLTKFSIVLSSLLTTTLVTGKIHKLSEACKNPVLKNVYRYAGPLAAALSIGAFISSAYQLIFNHKVDKENLFNDLKDTFITSTMVRSFTAITSSTGKFLASYRYLQNAAWKKRFVINGVIGSTYAALRGVIKPDKDNDKFSVENIVKGFVEGIFLGEGARLLSKNRIGVSLFKGNPGMIKSLLYLKMVLGAMVGSMLFGVTNYGYDYAKSIGQGKDHDKPFKDKSLVEHLFKGNSYPTII